MSEKIHTLESDIIDQVLRDQPDFVAVLDDLASRYGLPAKHVVLISNYLQKDLPPGVPAGADKLLALCQQVKQGAYSITTEDGDLVLVRTNGASPEPTSAEPAPEATGEPSPKQTQEAGPRSGGLSLALVFIALAALAAGGYFLYRYLGQ